MRKWCGAAGVTMLLVGAAGTGAAWADHTPGGSGAMTGATCSPSGTSLALTAENHAFDKDCLAVPAGDAFTIRFDNRDSDRHNVAILVSHMSTEALFQGDILAGPKSTVYAVPNMKAGTYHFHCEIHPNLMNGTFIVAAAPAADSKPKVAPTPAPTMPMGDSKPADMPAPAPKAAASEPRAAAAAPAAPAPKAAAAPAPKPAPATASAGGSAAPPTSAAAADSNLAHTGPAASRLLLLLAGLAFVAGGLSVAGGAHRSRDNVPTRHT